MITKQYRASQIFGASARDAIIRAMTHLVVEYNPHKIEKSRKNRSRNSSRLALSTRGCVRASRRFRKVTKLVSVPWERQDPDIVGIAEEEAPADSSHGRVH